MTIKKYIVNFTRQYEIEIDDNNLDIDENEDKKKSIEKYIINNALYEFSCDMEFGFITADLDCFSAKIINKID